MGIRGRGAARELTGFHNGVLEYDMFGSLPHTALGRVGRYSYVVYLAHGWQVGYIEHYDS